MSQSFIVEYQRTENMSTEKGNLE